MNSQIIIRREQLFFVGLLLYVLRSFCAYTSFPIPDIIVQIFWYITQASWIFVIFMRKEFNVRVLVEVILIIFGYINLEITGSWNMMALFFMLFASKDIEIKKIINFIFKILAILLCVNILWYFLNYALGRVTISQTREVNGETILRHNLYFNHANGFALYFLFTVLMFAYLYHDKVKRITLYVIMILAAVFVYVFPNTRTVAIVFVVFILLDIPKGKRIERVMAQICKHMYSISFISVGALTYLFVFKSNTIVVKINELMNGRLTLVAGALQMYGVNLEGHEIVNEKLFLPNLGYFTLYIDNFCGMLVVRYGLIATIIISFIAIVTSKRLYEQNKRLELILVAIIFVFGLSEATALDIVPVFPWLFFRDSYWYKKDSTKRKV